MSPWDRTAQFRPPCEEGPELNEAPVLVLDRTQVLDKSRALPPQRPRERAPGRARFLQFIETRGFFIVLKPPVSFKQKAALLLFLAASAFSPVFFLTAPSAAEPTKEPAAKETTACRDLVEPEQPVEKVFKGIPYKTFTRAKSWIPSDIYTDASPNDIYIGFSAGHTYFEVGGYRYDGGMNINAHSSSIRERDTLTPGAILRIKNAPPEVIEILVAHLKSQTTPPSWTCSNGVCNYLRGAGLDLPLRQSLIPSVFLKSILKNGVKLRDGRKLQFDLTVLGIRSLQRSIVYDRLGEAFLGVLNPISVIVLGGASAVAYFIFSH